MVEADREVVDFKFQALDKGIQEFVCSMFPALSQAQEKDLLTVFREYPFSNLSSLLKKEKNQWQWLFEDPKVWSLELNDDQKLAVQTKFPGLPDHIKSFAKRCIPCMSEIRQPFFDALSNPSREEMLANLEMLMASDEVALWAPLEPKIAAMIKAKLSSLEPEDQVFARNKLLKMSSKDKKVFAFDVLNLTTQKLSQGIKEDMRREKEESVALALRIRANVANNEELLKCPVCLDLPNNEIFCCSQQHVICGDCLPRLVGNCCPSCREDLGARPRRHTFAEAGVRDLHLLRQVADRVGNY